MLKYVYIFILVNLILLSSCKEDNNDDSKTKGDIKMDIKITSPAFEDGGMIPAKYTCDGSDISPPLGWENIPADAESIALICDDPDAPMGTFVHWVMYNVPADKGSLEENIADDETLDDGTRQGISSFGKTGYGGPCPPSGTHRYFFKIYALDVKINTNGIMDKKSLLNAMDGHVVAEGKFMGRYTRQK